MAIKSVNNPTPGQNLSQPTSQVTVADLTPRDLQLLRAQKRNEAKAKERTRRFEEQRQFREEDIARGLERGKELFGEGSLGRAQGFDAPAVQAARETQLRNLQRQQELQRRQLQGVQGRAGITGGLQAGQLINLQRQQQLEQQAAEQQVLLARAKQEEELEKFNLEQARRELLGQQTFALGEAGLGAAERGAVISGLAAEAGAAAQRQSGGGGKK